MDVEFARADLDRLETDPGFDLGQPREVVRAYRQRLQGIRSAADCRDLLALQSWRTGPPAGTIARRWSVRLTKDCQLVIEVPEVAGAEYVRILGIEAAV